jgi:peptide/nickel transport system permease protein
MRRVTSFLAGRLVRAVLTLLTLITLAFVLCWAIEPEPADFVYPQAVGHGFSSYQLSHAHHLLGTDRPKIVQYLDYLGHLARFDFGREWNGTQLVGNDHLIQQAINPVLGAPLRVTLSIVLGGALLVLLLAVPLGAIAGSRVGSWSDRTISLVALIGICTHPMVLGLILDSAFGRKLGWLPLSGYCPIFRGAQDTCGGVGAWATHLILPWITFALLFLALYTRMIRSSVVEALHEDYVRTARAKGASETRVLGHHVLPAASLSVLTMVGMEVGTAIGVSIYIEAAFGMTGLGRLAVQTMGGTYYGLDVPLTLAVVVVLTLIVIVGNLAVDFLYGVLDPRAGRGTERGTKSLAGGVL